MEKNLEQKLEGIIGEIKEIEKTDVKIKYSSKIIEKIKKSTVAKLKWPLLYVAGTMILGTIILYYSPSPNKSQNHIKNKGTINEIVIDSTLTENIMGDSKDSLELTLKDGRYWHNKGIKLHNLEDNESAIK